MTEEQAIYFTIIFMAFTYAAIGFGINKANAKYLLAGYNTMGTQKRSEFDIDAYLDFLKPFFRWCLGRSLKIKTVIYFSKNEVLPSSSRIIFEVACVKR